MLGEMRTLVGTSAGAIMAFMLALGMTSCEIEHWVVVKLREARVNELDMVGVLDMFDNMGLDKGQKMEAFLRQMWRSHGKSDGVQNPTFRQFAKITGKNLIVCASNLTTAKPEYFNVDTWPDLPVFTAIRASACIPMLFTPVIVKDMMFVDGGIFEILPVGALECTSSHRRQNEHQVPSRRDDVKSKSDPGVLVLNVDWLPVVDMPQDIVHFSWYLTTALLHRTNHICDVHEQGTRLGWTVVDVSPGDRDYIGTDERKERLVRGTPKRDVNSFMGFSLDTMTFDIDEQQIRRFIERGYKAVENSGCFDPAQLVFVASPQKDRT